MRVELVSVDSMAVYRGMDIGTTKPGPEVRAEVPYHLVDLVDPDEEFTRHPLSRRGTTGPRRHRHPRCDRQCWWAGPGSISGSSPTI